MRFCEGLKGTVSIYGILGRTKTGNNQSGTSLAPNFTLFDCPFTFSCHPFALLRYAAAKESWNLLSYRGSEDIL
jgi:hypothetical protein